MNTTDSAPASPTPATLPATAPTPTPTPTAPPAAGGLPVWLGPVAFALAVTALFANTFTQLYTLWERDPNYNHGFLVPFASLGIAAWLFVKRDHEPGPPDRKLCWIALALAGVCHLTALLLNYVGIDFLALFFAIRGGLMFSGDRRWAARFTFPLAFLVFMFPLPPQWLSWVALRLQDIAARVSETVLGLFVEVIRNGHNIRIAGMDSGLVVAEECSGTRQMVAFVAMAALIGYFTSKSVPYRLLLLVASVPVAVLANVLRVVLMNAGAYWFGTGWLDGWLHHAPALFSLPVGFLLFLAIDRTLHGLFSGPGNREAKTPAVVAPVPDSPTPDKDKAPPAPPLPADFGRRWLPAAVGVAVLVGVSWVFVWHITSSGIGYPEMPGRFAQLPPEFPASEKSPLWGGRELDDLREQTRKKLPFDADDLSYRVYQTADGKIVASVYLVHSRVGEDRRHHPEICIRDVSGAPEVPGSRAQVPLASPERVAQRFRFQTGGGRSLAVYYWHYSLPPSERPWSPLQQIHQAVGANNPSVTVQLTTAGDNPRDLATVEQTLLPQLDAALAERVLPPAARPGCDRLPVVFVR